MAPSLRALLLPVRRQPMDPPRQPIHMWGRLLVATSSNRRDGTSAPAVQLAPEAPQRTAHDRACDPSTPISRLRATGGPTQQLEWATEWASAGGGAGQQHCQTNRLARVCRVITRSFSPLELRGIQCVLPQALGCLHAGAFARRCPFCLDRPGRACSNDPSRSTPPSYDDDRPLELEQVGVDTARLLVL